MDDLLKLVYQELTGGSLRDALLVANVILFQDLINLHISKLFFQVAIKGLS